LPAFLLFSAAEAATLEQIQGKVSINQGEGYKDVAGPLVVAAGDRVMASPEGSAQVTYDEQCRIAVRPGSVVTVAAKAPCSGNAEFPLPSGLGGCSLKDGNSKDCHIEPDRTHLLVGVGAVALGVGGVILLTQDDDDDKPASGH
jgi:hypothetical protein